MILYKKLIYKRKNKINGQKEIATAILGIVNPIPVRPC